MADDIFLSPEEQDERAKQWLKDNGLAIAIGIGLGFGAIFGYNQYKDNVENNAEQASALFSVVLTKVNESEVSDIDPQVNKLKDEHSDSSYAAKAALLKATQLSVIDLPAAYEELQWVVGNAPEAGLVHAARIRQAKIKMSLGELDAARSLATQVSYDGFESHYYEVLGDIEARLDNPNEASKHYQAAIESLSSAEVSYSRVLTLKLDRLNIISDQAELVAE